MFIGATNNYIFLKNLKNGTNYVFEKDKISNIQFYPKLKQSLIKKKNTPKHTNITIETKDTI